MNEKVHILLDTLFSSTFHIRHQTLRDVWCVFVQRHIKHFQNGLFLISKPFSQISMETLWYDIYFFMVCIQFDGWKKEHRTAYNNVFYRLPIHLFRLNSTLTQTYSWLRNLWLTFPRIIIANSEWLCASVIVGLIPNIRSGCCVHYNETFGVYVFATASVCLCHINSISIEIR